MNAGTRKGTMLNYINEIAPIIENMTNESQMDNFKEQLYVREINGEKYVVPVLIDNDLMAILNKDAMVIIGEDVVKYSADQIISIPLKYYDNKSTNLSYFKSNSNSIWKNVETKLISSSEKITENLESRATINGVFWRKPDCSTQTRKTVSEIFIQNEPAFILVTVRTLFFKRGFLGFWVSASDNQFLSLDGSYSLARYDPSCNCVVTSNALVNKLGNLVSSISQGNAFSPGTSAQLINTSIYCLQKWISDCNTDLDEQNCWLN